MICFYALFECHYFTECRVFTTTVLPAEALGLEVQSAISAAAMTNKDWARSMNLLFSVGSTRRNNDRHGET